MAEKPTCIHRFIQARNVRKGTWRVYCADCGKWMRNITATGPDPEVVGVATITISGESMRALASGESLTPPKLATMEDARALAHAAVDRLIDRAVAHPGATVTVDEDFLPSDSWGILTVKVQLP